MMRYIVIGGLLSGAVYASAFARGVSPYVPLNLSPELDRKIERVLLLGDKPVMRRPIAAATVLDALPKACTRDRALCEEVRAYLKRFMKKAAVTHVRVAAAATDGGARAVLPNEHGLHADNQWEARVQAYYQPNDYLLIAAGGIAREDETIPTDSLISFGAEFAQFDVGYRDHWLSPLNDSSSLIGSQAPTMLSATLSNYKPISRFGFTYEVFAAEMSHQENIAFQGGTTSGRPRLAGWHLGIEPAAGYALAVNRVAQYGGGARGGSSLSDFFDALTTTSNQEDVLGQSIEEGNRVASVTSSILFQGDVPFAVHLEYAGEDNAYERVYRLGAVNLSLGIDFPILWNNFDASYEVSEWQNDWYTHHLYPEGLTNRDHVLGHWFGDNRLSGDAIGGRSHMLRAGWRLRRGDYLQAEYRNLEFDPRWSFSNAGRPYENMHVLELSYSTLLKGRALDAQLHVGRDIFGDSFARIGASFDFAQRSMRSSGAEFESAENSGTEVFLDVGGQYSRVREFLLLQFRQRDTSQFDANYHLGVGARRRVSERSDLGVRLEVDDVHGYKLLSLRAIDYRYRINRKFAIAAFLGAARYDVNLPADGGFIGAGVQYRDLLPGWDVGLDYRHYDKLTRDKGLPSDPESNPGLPRRILDIHGISLYLSKRW
ncbi:MAG: capsule assembly Wzi family protein [Steroidobacter sp.]